jgi:ubiquinone/menaquinone biosynthesis C-methylase UbiE
VINRWEFWNATADEVEQFVDLATTQRLIAGPAAEPNRFRQVHIVRHEDRVYYLKEFRHTQWKNRWRCRLTAPHCQLDGERELGIARALTERGIGVARPIASGRLGGASFYLCAELPGDSLRERLAAGALSAPLAFAAARFAGAILRSGVRLPDLSMDHIFVEGDTQQFAVIDLHNGSLAVTNTIRPLVRILRRFRRSLRGLPVPRSQALGFACRLLKAAGCQPQLRRRVIQRVPPMDTHGRYEVPGKSKAYRSRNSRRTSRELRLLAQIWPGQPGDRILDSPAGAGRLAATLTDQFGGHRVGADRAFAMLQESRHAGNGDPLVQADAATLPFHDQGFDGVVVFRFLHHLDDTTARLVVHEAARVAGRYVVISFFHPISIHGLSRRCKETLSGRARTRFSLTHAKLSAWFAEEGFVSTKSTADSAYLRDFWVAAFRRS